MLHLFVCLLFWFVVYRKDLRMELLDAEMYRMWCEESQLFVPRRDDDDVPPVSAILSQSVSKVGVVVSIYIVCICGAYSYTL